MSINDLLMISNWLGLGGAHDVIRARVSVDSLWQEVSVLMGCPC